MSTAQAMDRTRSCTFTFANTRHCRMPLSPSHPYLCTFHARKEAAARGAERAGQQIAYDLSSRYVSFADLSSAIAHTISAVAQRHMTPRAATSIAYLSQTLYQSISCAETDYVRTFGVDAWKRTMATTSPPLLLTTTATTSHQPRTPPPQHPTKPADPRKKVSILSTKTDRNPSAMNTYKSLSKQRTSNP